MWWHRMINPFLVKGAGSPQEINQSMVGVLTRLFTEIKPGTNRYDVHMDLNLISLPPRLVSYLIKAIAIGLVGLLAWLCRTRTHDRRDPRLLGEVALVVLTMLFISERSWKHHFVTLLLPYTYLIWEYYSLRIQPRSPSQVRSRLVIAVALGFSFILMATTSPDLGGEVFGGMGHEIAQGYGMFLWASVVLYVAVAWRVWTHRLDESPGSPGSTTGEPGRVIPKAHISPASRRVVSG
jgi:hypothetical protein